jgi:putative iron-dependent peroxidase
MTVYQGGIFKQVGPHHHYLEFSVSSTADIEKLRAALSVARAVKLTDDQTVVFAFGPTLLSRLAPNTMPEGLRDFDEINGVDGFCAPSTQRDLWVWIQGPTPDGNLDVALEITTALSGCATIELDVQGFAYHGNRDLIGFVDGTANPKTTEDQEAAALVPGSNGGSFLLTQKWVHDLSAFNAMTVPEQEAVVGRTKVDDIELEGDDMPADSHVSRTDASENGVSLKLWRRSAPYGGTQENGLYFVAFACDIKRFDIQLQRMYGVSGDGLHDKLIHYSKAVSGAYWYAPGAAELKALCG